MDWTRSEITELINLYKQYDCLWNTSHEDYNNYDTKQNAWLEIANTCSKEVGDVKRKVKNLRSAYVSEKKKLEASKDNNIAYKPNLFYFKDFDFLDAIVVLRKSCIQSATTNSFLSSRTRESSNKERKHKMIKIDRKSLRDTKFSNAIDSIVASVQQIQPNISSASGMQEEDDANNVFDSFGKTTALQLQQLPLDKATEAMAVIYQLVAKKTLNSFKKSRTEVHNNKRTNGVISFETMSP